MNDDDRVIPNPEPSDDVPFDFSALTAEATDPITGEFEPPSIKGSKPRWWERGPKRDKSSAPKRERKSRAVPAMPRGGLKSALARMYVAIGMSVFPFDPHCGRTIIDSADQCAEALEELAKTNPEVRRILISLVTASAWGAVITAHAPIVMAIALHHIPALRDRQEKMVGEFAEMFANMPQDKREE